MGLWGKIRLDKVTLEGSHIIRLAVLKEKGRGEMAHVLSRRWHLCSVLKLLPEAGSMILGSPDPRTADANLVYKVQCVTFS